MPYSVSSFESTPNPRAIKCVVTPPPGNGTAARRSYASLDEAERAEDGLAIALFGIAGVERVMVLADFVTVTRAENAKWAKLKPAIKKMLGGLA